MRWKGRRQSDNVEDRRGMSPGKGIVGGGMGLLIVIGLVMCMGGDPTPLIQQIDIGALGGQDAPLSPKQEEQAKFISVVLADTEDVWKVLFREMGGTYVEPKLVLFSGNVRSACGFASAAMGPFYCPADSKVYIDLSFYDQLERRFQAPGDFAQAYVLMHEVGHHVQNLLGTSDKVHRLQQRGSKVQANQLSVRLELQADFYAGVCAHHAQRTKGVLEPGDIEEAIRAAEAIGDDTLQRQAQGRVVPDSFTHGSSAQRMAWFMRGYRTGDPAAGNTFDDAVFFSVQPR